MPQKPDAISYWLVGLDGWAADLHDAEGNLIRFDGIDEPFMGDLDPEKDIAAQAREAALKLADKHGVAHSRVFFDRDTTLQYAGN
jgi:hypothetical protein